MTDFEGSAEVLIGLQHRKSLQSIEKFYFFSFHFFWGCTHGTQKFPARGPICTTAVTRATAVTMQDPELAKPPGNSKKSFLA